MSKKGKKQRKKGGGNRKKNLQKKQKNSKILLTLCFRCAIIPKSAKAGGIDLGVAQLVARYLGVVEAASSSLVTQTRKALKTLSFRGFFLFYQHTI